MNTKLPLFCLMLALLSSALSFVHAKDEGLIPNLTSKLSIEDTRKLLESRVTYEQLRLKINAIPMIRIGSGYVIYYLADGNLKMPISIKPTEKVIKWRLCKSDGTKVQQYEPANPLHASESDSK